MKKKDLEQIHKKSIAELKKQAEELKKELVNLKLKIKSGKEKNIRLFKTKRHQLAQIKTVLSEKEFQAVVPPVSTETKGEK